MAGDRTLVYEPDAAVLRHLNPKEVARKLGCSVATVRRWTREGKPGFPQPRAFGYAEYEVDRWIAESRIGATPRIGARA